MAVFALPRTLTLPSGARVTLRRTSARTEPAAPASDETPLFAEVLELFEHDVALSSGNEKLDVLDLKLADFHVVRAFLLKAGLVREDEVEVDCHNCGELLVATPCQGLETGPWEDGELDDPELDSAAPLGVAIETAPIRLGRVREARTLVLAPRTVREVLPLWAALAKDPVEIDDAFVLAMGVVELGPIREPGRIARELASDDEAAFDAAAAAFIDAHYTPRLGSDVFCPECKARNTVDAPAEREFAPKDDRAEQPGGEATDEDDELTPLPPLEDFVELAHEIAEPLIADIPGEKVELVVEDGTPAVDDGGEPLLGSYVPPPPRDSAVPTQPPTVTVYYQTFQRIEREEGPFDWDAELRETIEHELEHHIFHLRGDDPMDEEEHAEIDREALRVIGQAEARRRTFQVFGRSIPEFVRTAWPIIVIGALALAITLAEGRCT
jgi:hypothetical protein